MDKITVLITPYAGNIGKKIRQTVTRKPRVIKYEIVKQDALNF